MATELKLTAPKTFRYRISGDFEKANKLIIVLHGYGQLAEFFIRKFNEIPEDYLETANFASNYVCGDDTLCEMFTRRILPDNINTQTNLGPGLPARKWWIEFNDMVRKSAYSFEIVNNKLKIFPIPTHDYKIYIEYVVEKDKFSNAATFSSGSNYDVVSDYSNVPYQNVKYFKLNAVGKQWVKKYFLALCKENLGLIRQKYSTIPIPGGEVTLDGSELRSEASSEKETLITQLRENLEAKK